MPSWLSQYLFLGAVASGGGALGSFVTAPSTDILEVKIERLQDDLDRYTSQVTENHRSLERRIDALERVHPELF